jgi:hypothetical protein
MSKLQYFTIDELNFYKACAKAFNIKDFSVSMIDRCVQRLPLTLTKTQNCIDKPEDVKKEKTSKL